MFGKTGQQKESGDDELKTKRLLSLSLSLSLSLGTRPNAGDAGVSAKRWRAAGMFMGAPGCGYKIGFFFISGGKPHEAALDPDRFT